MFRTFGLSAALLGLAASAALSDIGPAAEQLPIFTGGSGKGHSWAGRRRKLKGYKLDAQRRGRRP